MSHINETAPRTSVRPLARPKAPTPTETLVSSTTTSGPTDSATLNAVSNPYGEGYEGFVTVKPQKWSGNRTPAEGMVARGDHLDGLLLNQGFTPAEIYGGLREEVARLNGLKNPNLIHPDKAYILPTKLSAAELEERYGKGESSRLVSHQETPAGPVAEDTIKAEVLKDVDVLQAPKVEGDHGVAAATVTADHIDSSVIRQTPVALGDQSEAVARVEAETVTNSTIAQAPRAEGEEARAVAAVEVDTLAGSAVLQAPVVEGDHGVAAATVTADTVVGSEIRQTPVALGDQSEAVARVEAETVTHSTIAQAPRAEGEEARAVAAVEVDTLAGSAVLQAPVVEGDHGVAASTVTADTVVGSEIRQTPVALGDQSEAVARVEADTVINSTIAQAPRAEGEEARAVAAVEVDTLAGSAVLQAPVVEGDHGVAAATVTADTVVGSEIRQTPVALGDQSEAVARVEAERVADSAIAQNVRAEGTGAVARAETVIGETEGEVVVDRTVTATGEGATAETLTEVGVNTGDLTVTDTATGATVEQGAVVEENAGRTNVTLDGSGGSVRQDVYLEGEGPADVTVVATGEGDSVQVVDGEGGRPRLGTPVGDRSATVVADGVAFPDQDVSGFTDVTQVQIGAEGAILGSDARNAHYVGEAERFVTINHEGRNGTVRVDGSSPERVFFADGAVEGTNGALRNASGNDVRGTIEAPQVRVLGETANSVALNTVGTAGDDRHEVVGPAGTNVVSEMAGGNDTHVVTTDGPSSTLITKTDGELHIAGARRGASEIVVDAGEAALTGNTRLSNEGDRVFLRVGGGGHDASIDAGDGQDLLVVDLQGDTPQPRIITREHSALQFWREDEGITPDGWTNEHGTIRASNFEGIVFRRDGEVVGTHGHVPGDLESFDAAAAAVRAGS